ncbi:HD-GYP domain-containing protein, partial [Candidatus Latescibacterota bacterium]
MDKNTIHIGSPDYEQLIKYAKALSEVHISEKNRRKELETAHTQLMKYADALNNTVLELKHKNRELQEAYHDTVHRLVLAAEYKDPETGRHIERIGRYCALLAEKLGLPNDECQDILYAAPMHDIGKIGIPDDILMKPSRLTNEEFEVIKTHTILGANLVANSHAASLQLAGQIAITHHEKWNGEGYPRGLSGDEIPLVGRIVALADVFDAITSKRPYKDAYPVETACDIIKRERGRHFDPDMADIFLENLDGIINIKTEV